MLILSQPASLLRLCWWCKFQINAHLVLRALVLYVVYFLKLQIANHATWRYVCAVRSLRACKISKFLGGWGMPPDPLPMLWPPLYCICPGHKPVESEYVKLVNLSVAISLLQNLTKDQLNSAKKVMQRNPITILNLTSCTPNQMNKIATPVNLQVKRHHLGVGVAIVHFSVW